ncbi:MAG: NrsF family protein, partial [Betaproteobacteria bacterium]
MKTDELIAMLAGDAGAVAPRVWQQRYALALVAGLFGAMLLMILLLGVRPDIADAVRLPMFWVKLAFPAALAAGALLAAVRLSRPGVAIGRAGAMLAAPVLAIWVLAALALLGAPEDRAMLIWGETWTAWLVNIPILSVPAFGAVFWVMKSLAPVRPAVAGAAAGLLAGAVSAVAYALHCPELAAPF